ncbi:MAG: hypothetical protein P8080_10640 [Gammaproteobacteria bacterium]
MQSLIRLFLDIAMHRRGPEDVPHSGTVLVLALAAYLATGALALVPGDQPVLPRLLLDASMLVLFMGALLVFTGRGARMMQTLAALLGTGALLTAASVPFVWLAYSAVDAEGQAAANDPVVLGSSLALIGLLGFSLLVTGHIVRSAMDWPYAGGVLVAVVYFGLSVEVFRRLFPEGAG